MRALVHLSSMALVAMLATSHSAVAKTATEVKACLTGLALVENTDYRNLREETKGSAAAPYKVWTATFSPGVLANKDLATKATACLAQ